jgi:Putative auto-transporter adhesin, head GIN domain
MAHPFKKLFCVALLCSGAAFAETVEGSGHLRSEVRSVAGVTGISLQIPMRVHVVMGTREEISITGDDNLIADVVTQIDGKQLRIRAARDRVTYKPHQTLQAVITLKSLDSVAINGGGTVKLPAFTTASFSASVAGAGDIQIKDITAQQMRVSIAGSGDVQGAGKVDALELKIAGSGDAKLAELVGESVRVSISGSGDAAVHATKTLNVKIAGSGDVRYSGDPQVSKSISGSGTVVKK